MTDAIPNHGVAATKADRLREALIDEEFGRAQNLVDEIAGFLEEVEE